MEGTGSYGSGLLRFLTDYGFTVIEVDRPGRSTRRRNGKSDVIDAEAAAPGLLFGRATGTPKSRDAQVEMIRALRVARRGAMMARIQAGGQIDSSMIDGLLVEWPLGKPNSQVMPSKGTTAVAAGGKLTDVRICRDRRGCHRSA